ncbi:MAG: outer membrane beta-barrel protein [Sulfuricurvum sp.]|nr:outer membrane beta-barrel protein [Sulfuricurvum sp.]
MGKIWLAACILAGMLHAESAERKGVNIGLGLGIGKIDTTLNNKSDSDGSAATGLFTIGYGVTNNLVIQMDNIGLSSNHTNFSSKYEEVQGSYWGLGGYYFWNEERHSPYIGVSIGRTNHESTTNLFVKSMGKFGDSYKLTAGYDYNQWFAELNYIKGSSERVNSDSLMFALGYNFAIEIGLR